VVQTVVLVSVVVGAVAALLLRFGPGRLGDPLGRPTPPAAVLPGSHQPVPGKPEIEPAPTAPRAAPAARSAPETVGAPVAAGAPTAPATAEPTPTTPQIAAGSTTPQPITAQPATSQPITAQPPKPQPITAQPTTVPAPPRRAAKNSGARHFGGDVRAVGQVPARP
jgi:hypothetical protein